MPLNSAVFFCGPVFYASSHLLFFLTLVFVLEAIIDKFGGVYPGCYPRVP